MLASEQYSTCSLTTRHSSRCVLYQPAPVDSRLLGGEVRDSACQRSRQHECSRKACLNWFTSQAFGRAVAIYDHDLEMRRMAAPEDAPGAAACVQTPKDMVQCL